jgi:hypothetical protein
MDGSRLDFESLSLGLPIRYWHTLSKSAMLKGEKCRDERKTTNEAFAAQACAVTRELDLDPLIVNPNGSGISLGHPVGGTGAIITTKAVFELHRIGGRYALVTMCIGGGQGIAAVFERT